MPQPDDAIVPVPPQQEQAWTPPPAILPPVVIEAVTELFKDGLPDPRGCEYHEIEIAESKTWTFKTSGWVLPGTGAQKYAIAWNGVIYPVVSVGASVDLAKEIAAIPAGQRRFPQYGWRMLDQFSSNPKFGPLPIHVAFLLRLGKGDLAEEMWDAGCADQIKPLVADPYVAMAGVWLDRAANRAAQAFLNHEDVSALAISRQVSSLVKRVEAVASAKGVTDPWPVKLNGSQLWQLPILEADLENRVAEKPYTLVVESDQPVSGPERIAALIHDLEQSYARQLINPGETNIADDPTVQALIKEGYPAVEPLLECLVNDNRLTRARYTQGMWLSGPIIPVYEAAYKALFGILNVSFPLFDKDDSHDDRQKKEPRDMSHEDRVAMAAKLTVVWKKIQAVGPVEGAYLALQDDNASPQDWFRAIDTIVQPADGSRTPYALIESQGWYTAAALHDDGFKAGGESLRTNTHPSVTDLLIKRFEQLIQRKSDASFNDSQLGNLLLSLASWDGKAHVADLKRMDDELDARFAPVFGEYSAFVRVALCEKRLQFGDQTALADYLGYLLHLGPDEMKKCDQRGRLGVDFGILWHYPDDPGVQRAEERLLSGKDAPLASITYSLLATPLLGIPAFFQEVLHGLDDKSPAGTVTVRQGGVDVLISATHTSIGESPGFDPHEPHAPKPGDILKFRLCDSYAYNLSQIAGFPVCKLYWPEAKRDTAVAACRAMLVRYGYALRGQPSDPYDDQISSIDPSIAKLRIKPLDHPATPDDVEAGRALFSLSGKTRVWKMASYPLGSAWQAEELFAHGKWQRYFGVFRDGVPTKLPAREMEFPDGLVRGTAVTNEIDAVLSGPDEYEGSEFYSSFTRRKFVPLGAAVPINIDVCNHNGEDQALPGEIELPPGAAIMLPEGITLIVAYSTKVPPVILRFIDPEFDFGKFQEIASRPGIPVAPMPTQMTTLSPLQKVTVFKADLRDYFDLSLPGTYHLKAQFHLPGRPATSTTEVTIFISPNKT